MNGNISSKVLEELYLLKQYKVSHEHCVEEFNRSLLTMANRDHELHDEKDKRIVELENIIKVFTKFKQFLEKTAIKEKNQMGCMYCLREPCQCGAKKFVTEFLNEFKKLEVKIKK